MNKFTVLSVAMPVDLRVANLLACSLWSVLCHGSTGKGPLKQAVRMQIPTASQWTWHDINRIFITLLYMFTKTIHQLNGLVEPQLYCVGPVIVCMCAVPLVMYARYLCYVWVRIFFIIQSTYVYTHAYVICLMALLTSPWVANKDKTAAIFSFSVLGCKSAIKQLIKFAVLLTSTAAVNNINWITKRNPSMTTTTGVRTCYKDMKED